MRIDNPTGFTSNLTGSFTGSFSGDGSLITGSGWSGQFSGTAGITGSLSINGNNVQSQIDNNNVSISNNASSIVDNSSRITVLESEIPDSGSWDGIFTGSAEITGSLGITGSLDTTGTATFGSSVAVSELLTITQANAGTTENKGLKLVNTTGNRNWNVTAGRFDQNNDEFTIRCADTNVDALFISPTGVITLSSSVSSMLILSSTATSIFQKLQNSTQSAFFGLNAAGAFTIQTSGGSFSDKLTITSGGLVGIGTTSPGQKIVVGGGTNGRVRIKVTEAVNNFGKFDFSTSDSATSSATMIAEITAKITQAGTLKSDLSFSTNSGDSLNTALTISSGGNVGIGTDSPNGKLDVRTAGQVGIPALGTAGNGINLSRTDGQTGLSIGYISNTGHTYLQSQRFDSANANQLFLNPLGGNVGIGTTNPLNKFVVAEGTGQHGVEIAPGTLSYIQAYDRATGDYGNLQIDSEQIAFGTNNGSVRMTILSDGKVGIGTDQPDEAQLAIIASTEIATGGDYRDFGNLHVSTNTQGTNNGGTISMGGLGRTSDSTFFRYAQISGRAEGGNGAPEGYMAFETTSGVTNLTTERMRISSGGVVQITKDQVTTNFDSTSFLRLHPSDTTDSGGYTNMIFGTSTVNNFGVAIGGLRSGADGTPSFSIRMLNDSITGTEVMNISSAGNVGIGDPPSASPNGADKYLSIGGNIQDASIILKDATETWEIYQNNDLSFSYGTTPTTVLTLQRSTGDVKINTGKLFVSNGNIIGGSATDVTGTHYFNKGASVNGGILYAGSSTTGRFSLIVQASDTAYNNSPATCLKIGATSSTSRSISAAGTVNASGADYAEYMIKSTTDPINKGDIVGVNSDGLLTNIFNDAISFVIKSTDPSFVGNDTWGIESEDKDDIEEARIIVDRVAFSGQVPCNVTGANVGDYIIPIASSDGKVTGEAVSNPTFEQYKISVGKVWKIMENGNSWVAVKIG